MSFDNGFTKDNLDQYLKELSKEFRKLNGKKTPAEIIIIGGASILINYGFRDMTNDIDAILIASSAMKDAISSVGDKYNLPNGWLNSDFQRTDSYSDKLIECSTYYRQFSNIVTVRTVSAEYLVAMKLKAGRKFKHDLSDIVGILAEHQKRGAPLGLQEIQHAVVELYGSWEILDAGIRDFIEELCTVGDYECRYAALQKSEEEAKDILLDFQKDYPGVTNTQNVDTILETLRARQQNSQSNNNGAL